MGATTLEIFDLAVEPGSIHKGGSDAYTMKDLTG